MNKLDYTVIAEGWVNGVYRKVGDKVQMTEAEAKYLGASVSRDKPKAASQAAKAQPKDAKAN